MKILFIARYFHPHIGGVEKHCLKISEELIKKNNDVSVITSQLSLPSAKMKGKKKKDVILQKLGNVKIYYLNTGRVEKQEKFRVWKKILHLKDLVRQADIVHCHDVFYWYLPFRLMFPRKKVYITFHGYEGNDCSSKKAIVMHKLAEKLTRGNICIGDYLKKWYKTNSSFVSYGAAKIGKINSKKKSSKKAMFLGRVEKDTGIMIYLNALKILKGQGDVIELDVFGDGKLLQKAKAYANIYKLKVNFKGFVEDVEKYISSYEIIFTSGYLGIIEALVKKRYVFSVYETKIKKDYLKMAPFSKFISISKDSTCLSKEIKKYINSKDKKKKDIDNGFNWAKGKSWKKLTDLYLKLWMIE